MSSFNDILKEIKNINEETTKNRLFVNNTLMINDGLLSPSNFGLVPNLNLAQHCTLSWIIALMFLGMGLLTNLIFGSFGMFIYVSFVYFLIFYHSFTELKSAKSLRKSLNNINDNVKDGTVKFSVNENGSTYMHSPQDNDSLAKSIGIVSSYLLLFQTPKIFGSVLLKHKNHVPLLCLMTVATLILIMIAGKVSVSIISFCSIVNLGATFYLSGIKYKRISTYLYIYKINIIKYMEQRVIETEVEKYDNE